MVKCQELNTNLPVIMNCSHPLGNFSYNSVCDFDCMEGFVLETPARLQCNKSGQWTEDIPLCNGTVSNILEKLPFLEGLM